MNIKLDNYFRLKKGNMIIQEFKRDYCCKVTVHNQGNVNLIIISEAIRRAENKVVDRVKTTINIEETNDWIFDSNSMASVIPWSWQQVVEEAKRAHLDYFAQRAPIENWCPLNKETNPDISDIYC
jgi:hypothetical protein